VENDLCSALNKIQAADDLKFRTSRFLNMEINKRSRRKTQLHFKLAAVCSVIVLAILIGRFSYNEYFTPVTFVDVDVNPSIGLTLNRFERVIEVSAYNASGLAVIDNANIRFKRYDDAIRILLEVIIQNGFLTEEGLVFVTVESNEENRENAMLEFLNQVITDSLSERHTSVQTDVFPVTREVRTNAHEHHVTPARYLAIRELQEVDANATFENCAGHSIGEIRERTRTHGGNHHNNNDTHNADTEHEHHGTDERNTESHGDDGHNTESHNDNGHNGESRRDDGHNGESQNDDRHNAESHNQHEREHNSNRHHRGGH